ncbi:MAG: DUF1573 domain-containing protein [Ignavibacteria bacterium]|nr:DUF1573 domain-containing protein [Ignavibacteria bacterium]
MKKLIQTNIAKTLYFLVGLVLILLLMLYVSDNSIIAAYDKGPKIVFKETEHDFGKVPQGPSLQYNFKFTNKGSGILRIEKVSTSCGCTAAEVGNKTEYKKNESGYIKVEFNTQGRVGHQEKTITVFTNDPDNQQVNLKIMCDIDPNMSY